MTDIGMLIIAVAGPSLICLAPLVLFPIAELRRAKANRQFQYSEFFAVRYGGSIERMIAESLLDKELLNEWCSQGARGVKRARHYVELWDPVPRTVVDEYLRRIGTAVPR
ncbi:MAG: hypothetical protein SPH79_07630 [Schaalia hyovaginalis]|uniref:Uncharacterized protein n=1 Tax=Schaalia hyovaginalis TaxID=29316 RepID=A0A923E128_9ACTO|nr:hypothetical protein [Schaalia hyovaginalis]MBB6333939.1 hypothetical protein [Schaalia hyovaginalis]MDY6214343.1 hypothetical protein [Schaalia hyovaginalis]